MLSNHLLRRVATITTASLLGGLLIGTAVATPALAAGEQLTLSKTGTASVLPGAPISYTLHAANPGTAPEYNVSFRDELPAGLTYNAGSTTPTGAGDPTVTTVGVGAAAHQVLTWTNITDLEIGGAYDLAFTANPDPVALPAGSSVTNTGAAYANTDPRTSPAFDSTGTVISGSYTQSATGATATTAISPITISKTEPSPEGKMLRGLHTQSTVYTLTVRNSGQGATNGAVVTDYLPATLEFLGCGALDNTSGGAVEYPGAPRLTATAPVPGCVMPNQVNTVTNPVTVPALPPGVYTQLTWNVGNLASGSTTTLPYRVGIPLRANTATFTGGTPVGATAQAANLDNNNGPSTRELGTAAAVTNHAYVSGLYQGSYLNSPTPGNTPVAADATLTRTINDVLVTKSVTPAKFNSGANATYTLTIRGGEYTNASNVILTDKLPDGLCPIDNTGNHSPDNAAECASGPVPTISGSPTGTIAFSSVNYASGLYTVNFTPISVPANAVVTVTYTAKMRSTYEATTNPTAAGDSYTNNIALAATTNPAAATGETGPATVSDKSSATITSGGPTIAKTILPSTTSPYLCNSSGYAPSSSLPAAQITFRQGDRICFTLRVNFPATSATRNPIITDFLPLGTTYEPGSATLTGNNTLPAGQVSFNEAAAVAGNNPTWTLGASAPGGLFVAPGSVFEARLAVIVTNPSATSSLALRGNLMKFRSQGTTGAVTSLRDQESFNVAPPPPVGIKKVVANVNGGPPINADNVTVKEGDNVTFSVTVTNNGTAATGTNISLTNPTVWDVLPTGITCASIASISNSGKCNAPGVLPTSDLTKSTISWANLPITLAPAASTTLTYNMAIPVGTGVSANLVNTGYVRSYQATTNTGATNTYYPASNVDTTVPPASQLAPVASDPSNVRVADIGITKTQKTSITEAGNDTNTQATIGEQVTYTVTATVPAHTTVYRGVLSDPMPTGITLLTSSATQSLDGGVTTNPLSLPGFTLANTGSTVKLTFPTTYQNTTNSDHIFTVTITSQVSTLASNTNGVVRKNTASFNSTTTAGGGVAVPVRTAATNLTIVVPAPTLTKTVTPTTATAGQLLTYTLTGGNTAGRPPSHDTVVVDCVPVGLTFNAVTSNTGGAAATTAGTGANGCATGTTMLTWQLGDVAAGATPTLKYTATVSASSAGQASYVNTATLTGSTLANGVNDCSITSIERCVTASASRTVTTAGATLTKTTSTPTATIGDKATYTVTATIPANINYYNASIIDALPVGLDPASVTLTGSSCTPGCSVGTTALTTNGQQIGWYLGDLTASASVRTITFTYSATVTNAPGNVRGTTLTNSAQIKWNLVSGTPPTGAGATFDKSSPNAAANVTIVEPNIVLNKTNDNPDPAPGSAIHYSVAVANAGAPNLSTAYNVTVTDVVPNGVIVDPLSISNGGTISGAGPNGGGTITWAIASLAVNANTTLTYTGRLAPSGNIGAGALVNTVNAGYSSQAVAANGRTYTAAPSQSTVTPVFPHVVAAKAAVTGGPAIIGSNFVWRITLTNTGAATAYQVGATDTLPINWAYQAGTAQVSINGGPATNVEPTITGTPATGQVLTWTGLGNLNPNQVATITITTRPLPAVATNPGVGSTIPQTNTATPSASDATGATGNATGPYAGPPATASTTISSADLTITKTANTPTFTAGTNASWDLSVGNNGPDTATGPFTVTDPLPAGTGYVSATGTGWSCGYDPVAGAVTCTRSNPGDTLAKGATFPTITITASIPASVTDGTAIRNTATVTGGSYDPNPDNNSSSSTTPTSNSADLTISKTGPANLTPGGNTTYTINVSNLGPSDAAANVVVTDALPTGVTYTSYAGAGWSCSNNAQTVSCTLIGPLAAGTAAPALYVGVHISSSVTSSITNTATVASPTNDPVPSNNSSSWTSTVNPSADLALTKVHQGTFTAGSNGTYLFTVTNNGPSDAAGPLTVTDTLPAALTYVSSNSADGWSCSNVGQAVTCTRGSGLSSGAHNTFTITVAIDPSATGNIHNSATVSSPTADPNPGNNTGTDDVTLASNTDLSIVKTAVAPSYVAGTTATYHLAVTNNGPSTAVNPVVTDTLPAGLTYVSATGTGWSCTNVGPAVTCSRATLSALASSAITITATISSSTPAGTLSNTANISSDTTDPNPGNNSSTTTIDVTTNAKLSIVKKLTSANPAVAGTNATFALTISNAGPSDASNVVVTDTLPAGLSYVSATGSGWTCTDAGATVTCQRNTMTAGTSAPDITVTTAVSSSVPDGTTLTNTAGVSTSTPGPVPPPATADVPVVAKADLALTKTAHSGTVTAGGTASYDLSVHNNGPSDAVGPTTITDTLPAGMSYNSATGTGWTCTALGQTVTCTMAGGVAVGATAPTLTVNTTVAADTTAGTLTNTATVSSPTTDPVPANNTATATINVTTSADLAITKTHTGNGVIGDPLAFTLTVTNNGPSAAVNPVVTDTLPAGLSYVSATGTGWSCTDTGQIVTCTQATLAPSTTSTITVTTTVAASAYPSVTNSATVHSDTPDPVPGNNTATDTVTVPPLVDLSITKTHTGTPAVGGTVSFDLTVTNHGPTADPGPVTVTDPLPAGLSYSSATGTGWVCTDAGQAVTCVRAAGLAVGETAAITLTAGVQASAYPDVINTATVTSPAVDTNPANNTASDRVTVTPKVMLSLAKTLVGYDTGSQTATWALTVANHGPNATTQAVVVVDRLPAGLTYQTYRGAGWTCTPNGQVVTCTYPGTVRSGDTATVQIDTTVAAPSGTTLTNSAEIISGFIADPDPGAHHASATVTAASNTPPPQPPLPDTGADVLLLLVLGLAAICVGAAVRRGAHHLE
jgi:uncharacterized repeat protein (TIGR01451 family)/fimbrial isopeptide formation D2 family protein